MVGTTPTREPSAGERLIAVGTIALIAADATLLLANLVRPGKRRG